MSVSVDLEPDEALVLFELLASRKDMAEQLKLEAPRAQCAVGVGSRT